MIVGFMPSAEADNWPSFRRNFRLIWTACRMFVPTEESMFMVHSSLSRPMLPFFVLMGLIVPCVRAEEKPSDAGLGAKPDSTAVVLFNGENLEGWVGRNGKPAEWAATNGFFTVGKGDIKTTKTFGDFQLHAEFNIPYMPHAKGQGRGNSGIYLDGIYELQVLDSYGLKLQSNDCGAIYQQIIPSVNACKPPLQWQYYDVTFHKAVVEDGKVVKKARLTVVHNGIKTIDDKEINPTPGGIDLKAGNDGPILLQDHGNAVEYRNLWIKPIK
jgi:Domain of Unknown Function (DUF1080)